MSATAKQWFAGARPRTLPAAVVPVAVGTAAGYLSSGHLTLSTAPAGGDCPAVGCVTFTRELS